MQLENLNLLTLLFYIFLNTFFIFLFIKFYLNREKLKRIYFLLFDQNKIFYLKYIFLLTSFLVLSLSIFSISYETSIKKTYSNIDIIFTLDVSKSMNSLDYEDSGNYLSRLDYSKNFIKKYILNNPEHNYGLTIFAGKPLSIIPITNDHDYFFNILNTIDYNKVPSQGSDLKSAIYSSIDRLFSDDNSNKKIMIIISDGTDESFVFDSDLRKDFLSFIIGVGSDNFTKIPSHIDIYGNIIYKKYNGNYVETKLNDISLKKLAKDINGQYFYIDDFSGVGNFVENTDLFISSQKEYKDFSRFLSIIGFLLFIFYLFFNFSIFGKN